MHADRGIETLLPCQIDKRVDELLAQARATVRPLVLRERECEKITSDIRNFVMR